MNNIVRVIKIGGHVIDQKETLSKLIILLGQISEPFILVHGGGTIATNIANQLGITQQMISGRRITDEATLQVVTMVYAGLINKNLVALLQAQKINAIGLCGADANLLPAKKRQPIEGVDYGLVGELSHNLNYDTWKKLLENNLTPVIAPITHDQNGQLLNTNADTIASTIATILSKHYSVELIFLLEKEGVLLNVNDNNSVISNMNLDNYQQLKNNNTIYSGMIPKLDNAFSALKKGVHKVRIGHAIHLLALIQGSKGTTITHE
jgi:acetylglutamate kinase